MGQNCHYFFTVNQTDDKKNKNMLALHAVDDRII